jgi:hypothetical protein
MQLGPALPTHALQRPPKKNIKDKYRTLVPLAPFVGDQGWNEVNENQKKKSYYGTSFHA